jgi:hypothetical protein
VDRKLIVPEGDGGEAYAITEQGVDYLYSGAGVGAFSRAEGEA